MIRRDRAQRRLHRLFSNSYSDFHFDAFVTLQVGERHYRLDQRVEVVPLAELTGAS
jgi:hypothetical protein